MNDEIKEILDYLKNKELYCTINGIEKKMLYQTETDELLDYITNLQTIEQQYSAILSENAELENKITNLQEELEITQEKWNKDKQWSECRTKEWLDYKSRCEKAIEKLESIRAFGLRSGKTLFSTLINESIDILNGGEE